MRIAFVEPWPTSVVEDFLNSFVCLNKEAEIFVIFDKGGYKKGGLYGFDKRIKLIPLDSIKDAKRIVFFPYYLMSIFSKKYRNIYLDSLHVQYYSQLESTLDGIKPDLVQSNLWVNPYSLQTARWCKKNNVPFILRTEMQHFPEGILKRGVVKFLMKTFYREVFDTARAIIPWTVQGEDFAKREFPVPERKVVHALPPGVDLSRFKPHPKEKNRSRKVQFVVVQRFFPYKNYQTVLDAVDIMVKEGNVNFGITFKGDGPLKEEIKQLVNRKKLEHQIHFDDTTYDAAEMAKFYSKFDALILPSRWESIGLVVPEAMACGLGIIISDTAGAQVYVKEGRNALKFKTGDPRDLAQKINMMTKEEAMKFGKESIVIAKKYSLDKAICKYNEVIKSLVR